jgi:hypothetical protein
MSDTPRAVEPEWSPEKHEQVHLQLNDAAQRVAFQVHARNVLIVAWFEGIIDPEVLHVQDGGSAPWSPETVYHRMAEMVDFRMAERGKLS